MNYFALVLFKVSKLRGKELLAGARATIQVRPRLEDVAWSMMGATQVAADKRVMVIKTAQLVNESPIVLPLRGNADEALSEAIGWLTSNTNAKIGIDDMSSGSTIADVANVLNKYLSANVVTFSGEIPAPTIEQIKLHPSLVEKLQIGGYDTLEKLANATDEELTKIQYVGSAKIAEIRQALAPFDIKAKNDKDKGNGKKE